MSAHNSLTLCQNLAEIGQIVFEIWPFKDGPLWADGGFPISGQVLHPTWKLYKASRQPCRTLFDVGSDQSINHREHEGSKPRDLGNFPMRGTQKGGNPGRFPE